MTRTKSPPQSRQARPRRCCWPWRWSARRRRCCRMAGRPRCWLPAEADASAVAVLSAERLVARRLCRRHQQGAGGGRCRSRRQPAGAGAEAGGAAPRRADQRGRGGGRRRPIRTWRMAGDAWEGFLSGNAESEPALAGALAADLSGYGDVRDLYQQAGNYVAGEDGRHDHRGAGGGRHRPHRRDGGSRSARRCPSRPASAWSRSSTASAGCRGRCAGR